MVRPATLADCTFLAERGLREQDVRELWIGTNSYPLQALERSFLASGGDAFTILVDGEPAAMFGVAPVLGAGVPPGVGAPWLLATPDLYRIRRALVRYTRAWVEWMNSIYPHLLNAVSAENTDAVRWLRLAGFEVREPAPLGVEGKPFHIFTRDKEAHDV